MFQHFWEIRNRTFQTDGPQLRMALRHQDSQEPAETRSDQPQLMIPAFAHQADGAFQLVATSRYRDPTEFSLGFTHPEPIESQGADPPGDQQFREAEIGATVFIREEAMAEDDGTACLTFRLRQGWQRLCDVRCPER